MSEKVGAMGGKGGNQWDDGGDHEGVTKIEVTVGRVIEQIRFDYIKNGQTKEGPAHGVKGARSSISTIEINHPDEYLLSVKGWSDPSNKIVGIQFITNTKTSDYYGYEKYPDDEGTDISLEVKDKKIVGFHGFAGTQLVSLGAYFAPIKSTPVNPSKKLKPVGGDEGASWDDGVFDNVKKIQVGQNNDGVCFVGIEYENGSQKVLGDGHGKKSALGVETFELTYPGEYITSVGVYYDKVQIESRGVTLVTCLIFKTNKQESQPFGMSGGEYAELKEEGHKIVGFHGKAGDWVHQIGVHVVPITSTPLKPNNSASSGPPENLEPAPPSKKLKAVGGDEGASWDDGVFDNVKKIQVGQNNDGVCFVAIEYDNGSQKVLGDGHGKKSALGVETFELTNPGEYITSVGVYYDKVQIETRGVTLVTCLIFKTNKQESQPFGMSGGEYVELKEEGHKIVGFHGKAGDWVHQIGVHVAPV